MTEQNSQFPAARLQDKLPLPLHPLADLAYNFWWSWSPEQSSLFGDIDYEKWEKCCHNPVKLLKTVSYERLTQLAADRNYCDRVEAIAAQFEQYMHESKTWASGVVPQITAGQPVAYFSIESRFLTQRFGRVTSVSRNGSSLIPVPW